MFILPRLIRGTLFVLFLFSPVLAQENRAPIDSPREPSATTPSAPLVTATATAERVRFVSPGSVVQLRLEVYNEAGQKIFDTELRGGNVLDWHLQDGAGQQLPSGSYACVLTSKSLSGRLSQRVGVVTVADNKTAVEVAGAAQLSNAQQQTIGPLEGNAAFTVLTESEAEALTTVTHDGAEGQVTRTRGALSFRVGDIFAGKDKEQMRLTEDGMLGIGTSNPQATLDVAGTIRAERVIITRPGNPFDTAPAGDKAQNPLGAPQLLVSGSGTLNRIAKWTDNVGTLGNSGITETAAGVGIGNTDPLSSLHVGQNSGYGSTTGLLVTSNLNGGQYNRAFQLAPRQTANPVTNSIMMYALPTVNAGVTVPGQFGIIIGEKLGAGSITSYAALATGTQVSLGATNNTHLLMGTSAIPVGNFAIFDNTGYRSFFKGNVGIGTTNPLRALQIGPNPNALFTLEPMDVDPNAGFIRFGDNTGWKLHIGRSRESSSGQPNTGTQGILMTFQDTGNIGIGTTVPEARLDVRGDIKLGPKGEFFAASGDENLRIIRGLISTDGEIIAGHGFRVSHPERGHYIITFDIPFWDQDAPAVTATSAIPGANIAPTIFAVQAPLNAGYVILRQYCHDANLCADADGPFSFIAIGPR